MTQHDTIHCREDEGRVDEVRVDEVRVHAGREDGGRARCVCVLTLWLEGLCGDPSLRLAARSSLRAGAACAPSPVWV